MRFLNDFFPLLKGALDKVLLSPREMAGDCRSFLKEAAILPNSEVGSGRVSEPQSPG